VVISIEGGTFETPDGYETVIGSKNITAQWGTGEETKYIV
jgi:hypothetical protein